MVIIILIIQKVDTKVVTSDFGWRDKISKFILNEIRQYNDTAKHNLNHNLCCFYN